MSTRPTIRFNLIRKSRAERFAEALLAEEPRFLINSEALKLWAQAVARQAGKTTLFQSLSAGKNAPITRLP